jgi:two-component system, NtrC family, sensor kinase
VPCSGSRIVTDKSITQVGNIKLSSLYVIRGRDQGKRFDLTQKSSGIGRDKANTIQLRDTEASRQHAEIRQEGDQFLLVDLGSSNGTFVNEQRITQHSLRSGDRVQIGRSVLIFTASDLTGRQDLSDLVALVRDPADEPSARIVSSLKLPQQSEGSSVVTPATVSAVDIVYRTAQAISHTLDIDELLRRILDMIGEWVLPDRGCLMLIDTDSDKLAPRATYFRSDSNKGETVRISQTILDFVMSHREGVLTTDALNDERWDSAASIIRMGIREAICVPMQGRYGVVGVLYIDTFTSPGQYVEAPAAKFNQEHLQLMIAIAHQAALAVEDTTYYSALVQSERLAAIGQTITTISHHIKNILQGIEGGSYLVREGLKSRDTECISNGWKVVEKNQQRIANLVLDMLSFSKQRKPELVSGDLNALVTDVVELVGMRAKESNIAIEWNPDPTLPLVNFDPDGIHRAVLNVVSNAIDACESGNAAKVKLDVVLDQAAGQIQICVSDNGSGISSEDLDRIFSLFESRKGQKGTGIGLAVSQKIMREHGGDIRVTSQPGKGSRFVLWLPFQSPKISNTQTI